LVIECVENIPYSDKLINKKLDEFEELFYDSVKIRLQADVSIASMLSGGIDSSLIAYFINKIDNNIPFYSIIFKDDSSIDESYFINKVASKLDLKVNYLSPTFKDLKEDLNSLIYTQSDIFRSLSIYLQYYLFKEASKNIKVILGGQGADELFGGYYHHTARGLINNTKHFHKRIELIGNEALKEFSFGLKVNLPLDIKTKLLKDDNLKNLKKLQKIFPNYQPRWEQLIEKFKPNLAESLIDESLKNNLGMLLRFEDRNAMNFSIENRTPFTDYRVIEFAHSLPISFKMYNGYNKYFLRLFANRFLPKDISWRLDKKGFSAPEIKWLSQLDNNLSSLFDFRLLNFKILKNYIKRE